MLQKKFNNIFFTLEEHMEHDPQTSVLLQSLTKKCQHYVFKRILLTKNHNKLAEKSIITYTLSKYESMQIHNKVRNFVYNPDAFLESGVQSF